jgi:hypothetical protein
MNTLASRLLWRSITSLAFLCGLALIIAAASPAAAQGTPEQRAACEGDAMRLCGQFVPNVDQIISCMSRNRRYLSAPCRAVFDGGGSRRRARGT